MLKVRCIAILAPLAAPVAAVHAATPDYPTKPIRFIAASLPGGASDLIARTVSIPLSENLGVQIVVDNRPGVGNTIGAEAAARSVPDGYTLFGCNIASLTVSPALYKKLGYDPERDFAPLSLVASNPNVLTIHPSLPAKTVREFIALAKANPGKLNYASAGVGTSPQLSMELFRMEAGLNIVHIPYKSVPPALLDLIAGRVESMFSTVPSVLPALRQRKVRALGVTSLERDSDIPDVPTIHESGMPNFEVISWQGVCTQSSVPPQILARLRTALDTALAQPATRKRLSDQGFQPNVMPAEKFAAFIASERAKWAKLVKAVGIEPQ